MCGIAGVFEFRPGRTTPPHMLESMGKVIEHRGPDQGAIFQDGPVGLVARRVVTRVVPGDVVATGQRIGLMKFGSRMDVFVPLDVDVVAVEGDRTVAGESVIARWPS